MNCGNILIWKQDKSFTSIYKDIMVNQTVPWEEISGNYEERLQKAIAAVDKLLKKLISIAYLL